MTQGQLTLRFEKQPAQQQPAFAQRIVGSVNHWEEHRVWTHESMSNTWRMTPGYGRDKATIEGTLTIQDAGEGRCRRVVVATFEVRVPLLGARLEKHIVGQMRESFERGACFIEGWIEANGLTGS